MMTSCSNERAFIRQSLFSHKVRLDGRGYEDYRELDLRLDRTEVTSSCELKIGSYASLLVQYASCNNITIATTAIIFRRHVCGYGGEQPSGGSLS
jgi:hypothetical protein